jgi:LysR family transcriptional regulator, hydrogen peroxide-inducible genes activator
MLTLRQLRYVDALARHGNFGRAAEECAISQPALSMQIRELEQELGAELVARRNGMTVLTEAGVEVARRAGPILSATRDLADCVHHGGPLLSKALRLGVIPTLAPYVLPLLLPELHRTHPDLCLDLLETQTKTLVTELGLGTLDVLLLALPLEKTEFETVVLFSDRFLLAVPADDPLPERARVKPSDVNARRLVLLEEGHCLRDQALIYYGERDIANIKLGATSLATVLQMVASGYGVTLLPEVAIDVEVRDERVKLLRFVEPQPHRQIGLAWRPTSPRKADFLELGRILLRTLSANSRIRRSCGALRTLRRSQTDLADCVRHGFNRISRLRGHSDWHVLAVPAE